MPARRKTRNALFARFDAVALRRREPGECRGDSRPPQRIEVPVTNNVVLKKVRVAFELKDDDIVALIEKSGLKVSKGELSAFCRRPDHRNYRDCGDQFLRNLLKGLGSSI